MQAIFLRKKGYSLNEIVAELGVSKSSASTWVRNVVMTRKLKQRLNLKIKKGQIYTQNIVRNQRIDKENKAREDAKNMVADVFLDTKIIKIMCALLYVCEGTKSPYKGVSFMNSDPVLMKLFLNTLRTSFSLDESRFRVQVHLHSYHDKDKQLQFWSKEMNIPLKQFIKPYEKKSSGLNKKPGYPGCANLRYHDVTVSRELRMIAQEFMARDKAILRARPDSNGEPRVWSAMFYH